MAAYPAETHEAIHDTVHDKHDASFPVTPSAVYAGHHQPQLTLAPEDIPNVDHLITEDDTPVDNIFSEKQQRLLVESLYNNWELKPFVALANVGLFFGLKLAPIVPDTLVSREVTLPDDVWQKNHRSYFLWEYGKPPEIVVEIVSNQEGGELTDKKRRYEQLGISYYVVFDPHHYVGEQTLYVYKIHHTGFVETTDYWLPRLGLGVMLWSGCYEDHQATWLRWCNEQGQLIKTGAERAEQAQQQAKQAEQRAEQAQQRAEHAQQQAQQERLRADQAQQRADQERLRAEQSEQRAQRLAERLKALGIDPDKGE